MKKISKVLWMTLLVGMSQPIFAGSNSDVGTVVGGIAGGIIGNNVVHGSGKTAATIGGAVVGSLVGNQVGRDDERSRYMPYHHDRWDHSPYHHRPYDYPQRYQNAFFGPDGRLYRRNIFIDEYGNRILTFCCHHLTPDGYCPRWVRVN